MANLPTGTVTFLFTDMEGSTRLAQKYPEDWEAMHLRHNTVLQIAMEAHDGYVFQIIGDAFCVAFHTVSQAVHAAVQAQTALAGEHWDAEPVKVRMGIHTGQAFIQAGGDYHGYLSMSRVQRLMSAAHGGQVLLSLAAQELVRDDLPEHVSLRDMGEHRLKDLVRPEHIFQLIIPNLPAEFPRLKTLDVFRHNLPVQLTTFIGREKEITEVRKMVQQHRLVTLTGAGGTGKTRLSLQVAAELLDDFPDGVWFVELAPLTNPDLITQSILSAFGIGDQPGSTSLQRLNGYLHDRQLLLLLDNCEHLIEQVANLVTTLLSSSEGLRILATSREAMCVAGELNWHVPSLSLPDVHHLPSVENLSQYEAVSLFIDRATLVQPHFTVTRGNAPAIAQICHRLDGIPLAIELAAARVKALDVEQIARRLDNCFSLLTSGNRAALPRHQTLRAAIDWSYDLLSDPEKILFQRLAIFAGGWTLESAEQVCHMEENLLDVFEVLAHLVDKSLVILENLADEARYRMLEATRQFAQEKLLASDECDALRNRHRDWFFELAELGERGLHRTDQLLWLHRLDGERDNLRAALEWSFASSHPSAKGIQMVCNLMEFWDDRSYFSEGFFWIEKAVEESLAFMGTPIRAELLYHYGRWTTVIRANWKAGRPLLEESLDTFQKLGDAHLVERAYTEAWLGYFLYFREKEYKTGTAYLEEAVAIFQQVGDRRGHGWALNLFSEVKLYEEDMETAHAMAQKGIALYKSCEDRLGAAICNLQLGFCYARPGTYREASRCMEEALEVFRQFGSRMWESLTLNTLGEVYRGLNEYEKAQACYRESLSLQKEACMTTNWLIINQINLGYAVLYRGDDEQAASIFKEALDLSRKENRETELVFCLAGFAAVAAVRGQAKDSALLYGAVDSMIQKLGEKLDPLDKLELDRYQTQCRSLLTKSVYEENLVRGHEMTIESAIDFALEQANCSTIATSRPADIHRGAGFN